jgi:hypothetical protein
MEVISRAAIFSCKEPTNKHEDMKSVTEKTNESKKDKLKQTLETRHDVCKDFTCQHSVDLDPC